MGRAGGAAGAERDRGAAGEVDREAAAWLGRQRRSGRRTSPSPPRSWRRPVAGSASKSSSSTRRCWRPAKRSHRRARPAPRFGKPGPTVERWLASLPFAPTDDQRAAFVDIDTRPRLGRADAAAADGGGRLGQDRGRRLRDAAGARSRPPGGADGADRDARRAARDHPRPAARRRGDAVRAADRSDARRGPPASPEPARQRRAGADHRDPRPDRADRPLRPPRPLRGRRAAPLRGRAAPRARLEGGRGDGPARPPHDRDADPADAVPDRLRRPRHDRAARAAGGAQAGDDEGRRRGRSRRSPTSSSASGCARDARRSSSARWSRSPRKCPARRPGRRPSACAAGEFRDFRVGLLHGQMHSTEKAEAMRAFSAGETDVLVATTVIEVGIDVPNATVMLIEGAERFGVSQLHQLRGRVGRGEHPSQCLLFAAEAGEMARRRLGAVERTRRRLRARRGRPRTARRRGDPRHPPERPAALRRRPAAGGRPRPGRSPRRGAGAARRVRLARRPGPRPAARGRPPALRRRRRRPDPALTSWIMRRWRCA